MEGQNKLKRSMAIGAAWMTGLRLSYRMIGLVSTVILARLLTPEDFGLVAIAMSLFALIDIFSKFGFETVLIQRKSPTKEHYDTAWTFNFIFGIFSAALLVAISGEVAIFYEKPEIQHILWVISFLFFLNGLKNVGVVDFQKHLTFEKEFKLHIVPKFISFFITIALALVFLNYWALVIGNVVLKMLEVMMTYYMHPYRPTLCLKMRHDLFGFSKWLMMNNLFIFLSRRSPELFLGKMIAPQAAAMFNLAHEIGRLATLEIVANLNRAIYPGYAKVSDDIVKLQDLYKDSIRIIAIIASPLGVGVALVSPFLVPLLLGDQWLEAIDPLVYLALGGSINALKSNSVYVFYALGKPRLVTFVLIFTSLVFVGTMVYMIDINGVTGAAQAYFSTSIIGLMVGNVMVKGVLGLGFFQQLMFYSRSFSSTLIMALFVNAFIINTDYNNLVSLISCTVIGASTYTFSIYIFWVVSGRKDGPERKVFDFIANKLCRS